MTIYRSVPTEVEAIQFKGMNYSEVREFVGKRAVGDHDTHRIWIFNPIGSYLPEHEFPEAMGELWVQANNRWLPIEDGEWIIRDEVGFYPCKEEIFAKKYVEVSESEELESDAARVMAEARNPKGDVVKLEIADSIDVYGRRFVLTDMVDLLDQPSKVIFRQPVELLLVAGGAPEIVELDKCAEDARMLGRIRLALIMTRPMSEVDAICDRVAMAIAMDRAVHYQEGTLQIVRDVLAEMGMSQGDVINTINCLHNAGILFNEREKVHGSSGDGEHADQRDGLGVRG